MPKIEIRGEQFAVGDLFGDKFAFSIPPYQRPYVWTTEHAGELLDDLLGSLGESVEAVEELSPYFLGSIVLTKGDRPNAQIVDGQQRLITLTILLAVLRALVPERYTESVTRRLYEPADPLNNIPARFRLQPKERDIGFFQDYIQSEGGVERLRGQIQGDLPDSQRNMRDNALLYLRQLSTVPEAQRIRLAQFVIQRCLLVVVSTPDLDSAYRIFSILNDRGLDLSYADILKAEIIGRIPELEQPEYTARWEQLEESLGRKGFEELFGHVRAIYTKGWIKGTVLDGFRKRVMEPIGDPQKLIDDVLAPLGNAYYVVQGARYEHTNGADQINALLRWLQRIDNHDWLAPAVLYLSRYHDAPDRLARFFSELERLAASMMLRRQYGDKRTQRYARLLRAIENGENLSQPTSPIQLSREECEATIGALSGDVYLMPPTARNYLLLRLDSFLAASLDPGYAYRTLTVEHVLPRTPKANSDWVRWFPNARERATYVHRLGNLVLLSRAKNAQASNYDFDHKKTVYFAGANGVSPYALTTQVLREREWTPQVIERRQQELLQSLKTMWRL